MSRETRYFWVITLLLVGVNVGLAAHQLSRPGIYYDEILLLMPAFDPRRWHLTPAWSPVPFFLNFYIGGLRVWFTYPFTRLFPISVELLRVPNIALYALSLLILARKYRRLLGAPWAIVIVGALALNTNLIASARADFVPFLFGFLFRGWLVAWIFERGLSRTDAKSFGAGAALLIAGIFHRLDFVWAAGALLVAGFAVELVMQAAEGRRFAWPVARRCGALGAISLAAAYGMSASVQRAGEFGFDYSVIGRVLLLYSRLEAVLLGKSFLEYNLAQTYAPLPGTLIFYLALMLLPFFTSPRRRPFQVALFCAVYSFSLFFLMLFIRRVGASWHMLLFEPMLVIWWATGAYACTSLVRGRRGRWLSSLVFGWLLVIQGHNFLSYQKVYALPDREISFAWNRAIYALVEARRHYPDGYFVNLGWGTHHEAGALAFNRPTDDGRSFTDLTAHLTDRREALVVTPAARLDAQVGADAEEVKQFRRAVITGQLKAELVESIGDPGYPVYEIWRCRRP